MDTRTPAQVQEDNINVFMEDGPRLSRRYGIFVVARDRRQGMVLLGGLGALGVGQMWTEDDGSDRDYPGYDDAPEQTYPGASVACVDNALREQEFMTRRITESG